MRGADYLCNIINSGPDSVLSLPERPYRPTEYQGTGRGTGFHHMAEKFADGFSVPEDPNPPLSEDLGYIEGFTIKISYNIPISG